MTHTETRMHSIDSNLGREEGTFGEKGVDEAVVVRHTFRVDLPLPTCSWVA